MQHEGTLTVPEVAQMLRVSRQTIYNLIREGKIPHFRVGSKVRFNRKDVEAFMQPVAITTGENK